MVYKYLVKLILDSVLFLWLWRDVTDLGRSSVHDYSDNGARITSGNYVQTGWGSNIEFSKMYSLYKLYVRLKRSFIAVFMSCWFVGKYFKERIIGHCGIIDCYLLWKTPRFQCLFYYIVMLFALICKWVTLITSIYINTSFSIKGLCLGYFWVYRNLVAAKLNIPY